MPNSLATLSVPANAGALQDVTGTPAGPYFVHHPSEPARLTVLFMPGGPGTRDLASLTYDLFLAAPVRLPAGQITTAPHPTAWRRWCGATSMIMHVKGGLYWRY